MPEEHEARGIVYRPRASRGLNYLGEARVIGNILGEHIYEKMLRLGNIEWH